jgi:glycosyltransferase involved in cell wall biosynthesis
MRTVLMVAFHFPPLAGSSGVQRTLRFVQQLPAHGWQTAVLSAHPRAYERTSDDLGADIPSGTTVCRAFALDTARHLTIGGRYLSAMARPDRWASWRFDAVRQGLGLVRRLRPAALWSTFPIATAHQIAGSLRRRTRLPWIADFRDPMAQSGYPSDPKDWAAFKRIESMAVEQAALCVFSTPSAVREYRERYPKSAERIVLLENGYDEQSFADAELAASVREPLNPGAMTLLHSGIVYPEERDPRPLLKAVRDLVESGRIQRRSLRLRFRAPVHDRMLRELAAVHGIGEMLEILPPVPYREALREMLRADALLVMQSADCNAQVPAKLYEYLRAGRPVLCLGDPKGDTAHVCRAAGLLDIAQLEDTEAIAEALFRFVEALHMQRAALPTPEVVRAASREQRSRQLASWLDQIAGR